MATSLMKCGCSVTRDMFSGRVLTVQHCSEHYLMFSEFKTLAHMAEEILEMEHGKKETGKEKAPVKKKAPVKNKSNPYVLVNENGRQTAERIDEAIGRRLDDAIIGTNGLEPEEDDFVSYDDDTYYD